jgi:hypothetical protein
MLKTVNCRVQNLAMGIASTIQEHWSTFQQALHATFSQGRSSFETVTQRAPVQRRHGISDHHGSAPT